MCRVLEKGECLSIHSLMLRLRCPSDVPVSCCLSEKSMKSGEKGQGLNSEERLCLRDIQKQHTNGIMKRSIWRGWTKAGERDTTEVRRTGLWSAKLNTTGQGRWA